MADFIIMCVGGIIAIMVLTKVLTMRYKNKIERTFPPFSQVIQDAAIEAFPETEDFDKLLVMGVKNAGQIMKGYEQIQRGYDSLSNYIVCYRGNEMYIMAVRYLSRTEIKAYKDKIMYFKEEQVKEIRIRGEKIFIFFKGSKRFFAMEAKKVLISPQIEQYEAFMKYIKKLAA